ncbi:tag-180 [Cordylochernes scorpioides]|uniref:Tag-180 n=1 Tax=Cordylochernes scorpioides TaxID=51811 RepID=A0ABY6K699_9ARAC|nr:tag-180 [Cordylochernes scorpioides]
MWESLEMRRPTDWQRKEQLDILMSETYLSARDHMNKLQLIRKHRDSFHHSWYQVENPKKQTLQLNRRESTQLARWKSGHLHPLVYKEGAKSFPMCTRCKTEEATPQHILNCIGKDKISLYREPRRVLELLYEHDLQDLYRNASQLDDSRSGSMYGQTMNIMRISVKLLLETLGENDYVNVAWFQDKVGWVSCFDTLVQANDQNKRHVRPDHEYYEDLRETPAGNIGGERLHQCSLGTFTILYNAILIKGSNEREAEKMASLSQGLEFAFQHLAKFQSNRSESWLGAECHQIIALFSDGGTEEAWDIVIKYNKDKHVRIFTYAVGPHPIPFATLKSLACLNRGLFIQITGMVSIRVKVQEYLTVLSRPVVYSGERNFQWNNFHLDTMGIGLMTTLTLPVFNRTDKHNQSVVGVMGLDITLQELMKKEPKYQLRKAMIDRKVGEQQIAGLVRLTGDEDHVANTVMNYYYIPLNETSFSLAVVIPGDRKHFLVVKGLPTAAVSMELPLVNVSTCELRSVIRFFTAKNETAVNIHRNLVSVYGEGCMSIQMVRRWRSWFLEGRQNVHDDERSGRPVTATDNAAVAAIRNVVEADRRVTIDEIMIRLLPGIEIGRSSIGTIMLDVLDFCKVCARWATRLVSENHKQQRMEAARAFLEMHQRDGDQLFSRIVTGDESWVHHSTPETKRQSMVWKKPEESAPKRRRSQSLQAKLWLSSFGTTNPPYSPDLASSDFHLFPALKLHLGVKHFANDDEVQAEANHWLRRQGTAWYNSGVKKLLQRYQKCLDRNGNEILLQRLLWDIKKTDDLLHYWHTDHPKWGEHVHSTFLLTEGGLTRSQSNPQNSTYFASALLRDPGYNFVLVKLEENETGTLVAAVKPVMQHQLKLAVAGVHLRPEWFKSLLLKSNIGAEMCKSPEELYCYLVDDGGFILASNLPDTQVIFTYKDKNVLADLKPYGIENGTLR